MDEIQARAEINLTYLHKNIEVIKNRLYSNTKIGAVVKADGYGHGAIRIVEELVTFQLADMIIVGKVEEAIEVKSVSQDLPILILGNVALEELKTGLENLFIFSVYNFESLRQMNHLAKQRKTKFHVHIRIDLYNTGMGFSKEMFYEHQNELFEMSGIEVEGIYSHLYSSYSFNKKLIRSELESFDDLVQNIPGSQRNQLQIHVESSPLIFLFPEYQYDMVRSGTAIYGLPCTREEDDLLHPILSLKANIFQIHDVQPGKMLAYHTEEDSAFKEPKKIARVMFGYWDCPFLMTRQPIKVWIHGKLYDVLDEPCMDNTCIDITGDNEIQIGDEVCFLGEMKGISLQDTMRRCNINLEHSERLCIISKRLSKKYVYLGGHMVELLMSQVHEEAPLLREVDDKFGDWTLEKYLDAICPASCSSVLPDCDVSEAINEYLLPLVGEKVAKEAAIQVEKQKLLLTANHHEVEFCVQSFQGNILYDALLKGKGFSGNVVPILSNTTVNMSNANFPRGMMIYHTKNKEELLKIPIFPFKMRNSLVAAADPFTRSMVESAQVVLKKEYTLGHISEYTYFAARHVLEDYYLDTDVLTADRYAEQALMINRMIGKELYHNPEKEVLYIELEEISRRLLVKDIQRLNTLTYQILFDDLVRLAILKELDGKVGCWGTESLVRQERPNGTHFFWGVDERKRRFPFCLVREEGKMFLHGVDMSGGIHHIPYTADHIIQYLEERKMIPGLFLSFLELHLLRNYTLLGGCFQSIYLQDMNEGLIRVLDTCGDFQNIKNCLKGKKNYYLSGPIVAIGQEDGKGFPVSTIELLEQGGITERFLSEVLKFSIREADKRGLFTFYGDLIKNNQQRKNWWFQLKEAYGGGTAV